jgi:Flp pilus assembly protein TadG
MMRLRSLIRDRSGAAAIEFAILAPVAFLMFCGTYEITHGLVAYMKLTAAVNTVGDLIAQQKAVASATIDDFYTAEQLVMAPLNTGSLGLSIASVTFDPTTGKASQAWQETRGTGVLMTDDVTASAGLGNAGDSVIVTQATYTYTSLLKYVLPQGIPMTERIFTRPRLISTIPYTN